MWRAGCIHCSHHSMGCASMGFGIQVGVGRSWNQSSTDPEGQLYLSFLGSQKLHADVCCMGVSATDPGVV